MSDFAHRGELPEASIDVGLILRALGKALPRMALVTVLLCGLAYAVLLFVPKSYESRAELLVEPRGNPISASTISNGPEAYLIDEAAVASQIELIKSRDTIRATIDALGLREDPGFAGRSDEQIIATIADDLAVSQERSSRLIAIAYRSGDPDLAARVANGIAVAHIGRRAGQQISDTIETTGWLQAEIERLRAEVVAAERAIAEFRVANDLFVGANNESLTSQQLSNFSAQITAAAERRNAAQSRAQLIRALLESGQSVTGVSDVQASSVGQQLSQEVGRLQGERAQRSATLLPNHPTIRALDAQIGEIESQIAAEGRRVASALEAQAQIEADLQASLEAELERLKVTAGNDTRDGVALAELEREASAQRELLNAYLLRLAEATARSDVNSALPDVRMVSEAAPPVRPAAPQIPLILISIGIVSVLLQAGAVIFRELLSGRALVEKDEPEAPYVADAAEPASAEPVASVVSIAEAPEKDAESVPYAVPVDMELDAIAASVVAGIDRVLVVATADKATNGQGFAERLSARLIGDGISVAEIDAASGAPGIELGLTDLCAEAADFGDVVHRGGDKGQFAYVPWGQAESLALHSPRPVTLVEALSDIYECVVVVTGQTGTGSSLPMFAGTGARCLLLCQDAADCDAIERDVAQLGFARIDRIALPSGRARVA
ncbi:GumC family protein [Pelagibacterium lacus]|uniref:Polysaccharide chain length determinant N-terminal domain-containing protein n=1 Tax=Pelagibacterium lacus TaxID=2282655 RepID=A0A369W4K6_9HYPH|nr:GumC family protein [Pelagibacterium lacus]RDE08959.1 hypothetical protein DVH29_08355 [Pelagibacterium lacus]